MVVPVDPLQCRELDLLHRLPGSLLVDQLGLPFVNVSTELERLDAVDGGWWALGKILAYSLQDRPFVHLDTDVFLWKPLPRNIADAPVFTQCIERFHDASDYRPHEIEAAFSEHALKLPVEWQWTRKNCGNIAENCGILGGSDTAFLRHYSQTALDLVTRPENARAWSRLPDKGSCVLVVEQFFLAACAAFHRSHATSPYAGVRIANLFPSWDSCNNPNLAARMGFTHLICGAKSHPAVAKRLEERSRREDPSYFRRCEKIAGLN